MLGSSTLPLIKERFRAAVTRHLPSMRARRRPAYAHPNVLPEQCLLPPTPKIMLCNPPLGVMYKATSEETGSLVRHEAKLHKVEFNTRMAWISFDGETKLHFVSLNHIAYGSARDRYLAKQDLA